MDDSVIVDVLEGGTDLGSDVEHFLPGKAAALLKQILEALSVYIFHRVKIHAVLKAGFIEADDPRMLEGAERVDLTLKALQETDVLGQFAGEDLDRRLSSADLLVRAKHPPHAAAAELLKNHPLAQAIADHGNVSRREWLSTIKIC